MDKFLYSLLVSFALIVFVATAVEPLTITIDQIDTTKVDAIYMAVSVTDANKEGVIGLDSSNFQILLGENKQVIPKQVENFYNSEKGVAVVVCIDASLTMKGKPIEDSKIAVKEYLDNLRSQDRVAIISFHSKVDLVSDFSMNREYLKQKIDGITAGGTNTELYYAIDQALKHLKNTPSIPARKLVIVISDGRDEGTGAYNLEQCIQEANRIYAPIYSVGFTKIDEKYLRNMEALSDRTKGKYFRARESSVIRVGFNKSLDILKSQYALRFNPPNEVRDGKPRFYSIVAQKPNFLGQTTFQHTLQPSVNFDDKKETETKKIPLKYWLIIAAAVIVIGVGILFVLRSQRKKIKQEAAQAQERDEATRRQLEEAQRKEDELRKQLAEKEKSPPQPSQIQGAQGTMYAAQDSSKTRMEPFAQPSSVVGRKTMVGSSISGAYTSGQLVVTVGSLKGQTFNITRAETTIGRGAQNEVVLQEPTVSSSHATIRFANGQFQLTDNQSTNGSFVNGQRTQMTLLKDGDIIRFGQCELQFKGN